MLLACSEKLLTGHSHEYTMHLLVSANIVLAQIKIILLKLLTIGFVLVTCQGYGCCYLENRFENKLERNDMKNINSNAI